MPLARQGVDLGAFTDAGGAKHEVIQLLIQVFKVLGVVDEVRVRIEGGLGSVVGLAGQRGIGVGVVKKVARGEQAL